MKGPNLVETSSNLTDSSCGQLETSLNLFEGSSILISKFIYQYITSPNLSGAFTYQPITSPNLLRRGARLLVFHVTGTNRAPKAGLESTNQITSKD
jgi:hypothetical protein